MSLNENDWIIITYVIAFCVISGIFVGLKKYFKDEIELRQNFYDGEDDTEEVVPVETEHSNNTKNNNNSNGNSNNGRSASPAFLSKDSLSGYNSDSNNNNNNAPARSPVSPRIEAPTNPILISRRNDSLRLTPQFEQYNQMQHNNNNQDGTAHNVTTATTADHPIDDFL
jgi:hypothetical protein